MLRSQYLIHEERLQDYTLGVYLCCFGLLNQPTHAYKLLDQTPRIKGNILIQFIFSNSRYWVTYDRCKFGREYRQQFPTTLDQLCVVRECKLYSQLRINYMHT